MESVSRRVELLGVVAEGAVRAVLQLLLELADDAPFVCCTTQDAKIRDPWAGSGPRVNVLIIVIR